MSNGKSYESNRKLIDSLSNGCQKIADNVGSTMGPKGRNVILRPKKEDKKGDPVITKDGVTVANFVDLENDFEDLAAQVIKQSAIETNKKAGDGTTTATILANEIYQQSVKYLITDSVAPKSIKNGILKLKGQVVDFLRENKRPVQSKEDIKHIASISSNGDEDIGDMISLAVDKVGKDGSIVVEESKKSDTVLEFQEGFQIPSGFISPKFVNDERNKKIKYDDKPLVLVTDHQIDDVSQMMETLKQVAKDGRPLLIVAGDVKGQALAALIMNKVRGTLDVAAVRAPFYGKERTKNLQDLAVAVGATFISGETGEDLSNVKFSDLGACESVEVTQGRTTLIGGKGSTKEIDDRIEGLKGMVESEDDLTKAEKLQDRVARLASGVAIIRVGGSTKVELNEKKHRIEDALEAVKSAQSEGVLPGGGTVLLRAAEALDMSDLEGDERIGGSILKKSLRAPVKVMSGNADISPDIISQKIINEKRMSHGFNFMTTEMTDLYEDGIIDPVKVTRNAFENAVSSASTLLMSSHAIVE